MVDEINKNSCLNKDGSGLDDESPEKIHEPVPTFDLEEITASAADEGVSTAEAALHYPDYLAHEYRQDRYDYTPGRGGKKIEFVVMHFMAGSFWGSVDWNLQARAQTSWHYGVAHDGYTIQVLSENDRAWHAGNWYVNERSVGIEQAGNGTPDDWTDAMLKSSAKLASGIVLRHGIPIDRQHIFGHSEVQGASHTDVGNHFPWSKFMRLVRQYAKTGSPSQPEPKPEEPKTTTWYNFAHSTNWGKKHAAAAVKALHENGYRKTGATENVEKSALDADDGKAISIVLGHTPWRDVPKAIRGKVEQAMEDKEPYKHPVWYADSDPEVRWRLGQVSNEAGLDWAKVKADYLEELGSLRDGPNEPETPDKKPDEFVPGKDVKSKYSRTVFGLVGKERYSRDKIKAWAATHDADSRYYDMVDAIYDLVPKMWREVGNPVYSPDMACVQVAHETRFCRYGGDAKWANPAGIKLARASGDRPQDFEVPKTAAEGAKMLLNHVAAYIHGKPYGTPHGRYWVAKRARQNRAAAETVDDFTQSYAADPAYAKKLKRYLLELEGENPETKPEKGNSVSNVEKGLNYVLGLVKYNKGYRLWQPNESLLQPGFWGENAPAPDYVEYTFCASVVSLMLRKVGKRPPRNRSNSRYNGGMVAIYHEYGSKMIPFNLSKVERGDIVCCPYENAVRQGHVGVATGRADDPLLQSFRGAGQDGLNTAFTVRQSHDGGFYTHIVKAKDWID